MKVYTPLMSVEYVKRSDKYRAVIGVGDGRRKVSALVDTPAKARALERTMLNERDSGLLADCGRMTVAQFFDFWLRDVAPSRCGPGTMHSYRQKERDHIRPALGHVRLSKLGGQKLDEAERRLEVLTEGDKVAPFSPTNNKEGAANGG